MPASQNRSDWRGRWLPVLFWTGVGLAPLAALFLLLGQGGGPLRLAAVLAILCVVLIGSSVALRNDTEAVRAQLEAMVLDEVDAVREQTREDIVAVARKLHSTLREEVADLADQVDELRDPQRSVGSAAPAAQGAGYGRSLTGADSAGWRQAGADGHRSHDARPAASVRPVSGATTSAWSGAQPPRQRNGHENGWSRSAADIPVSPSPVSVSPVSPSPVSPSPVSPSPVSGGGLYGGYGTTAARRRAAEPEASVPVAAIESARQTGRHPGQRDADPWADLRGDAPPAQAQVSPARGHEYDGRYGGYQNGGGQNGNGYPTSDRYSNGNGYPNGSGHPQGSTYSSHYDGYQHADPDLQPHGYAYGQTPAGYPNGYAGSGHAGAATPYSPGPDRSDPRWGGTYR